MRSIKYVIHDETGQIVSFGECPEDVIDFQNITQGCTLIKDAEGHWNTHYVVNGKIVLLPPKSTTEAQVFDYEQQKWVKDTEKQKSDVLTTRSILLYQSDWTQIPNNPLTPEQQQAWAVYRQELRDVTSQSGYPFDVVWPTPPA